MNAQAEYYEGRARGLGREFLNEVQHGLQRIQSNPEIGTPVGLPLRSLRIRRFPHSIVYGPAPSGIFVVAVAHHSRRPGYWRDRV